RQVPRVSALENAVAVTGRLPVLVDVIRPIGDQAAGGDEVAVEVDRGQLVPDRQLDDQIAIKRRGGALRHDQSATRRAREGRDGTLDLAGVAHVDRVDPPLGRGRQGWDGGNWVGSAAWGGFPKNRRSRYAGRDLLEQLQPFPTYAVFGRHETGGIAARPRQARHETGGKEVG